LPVTAANTDLGAAFQGSKTTRKNWLGLVRGATKLMLLLPATRFAPAGIQLPADKLVRESTR
jgi:hypothetical protein